MPLVYPVQVNLTWWKGLTDDQRKVISKAVADTEQAAVTAIEKEYKDDIDIAKKAGDTIYNPTDSELAEWKKATYDMSVKTYLSQAGDDGKTLVSDINDAMGKSVGSQVK